MSASVSNLLSCCSTNNDSKFRFVAKSFSTLNCEDGIDLSHLLFDICDNSKKRVELINNAKTIVKSPMIVVQNQTDFFLWEEQIKKTYNADITLLSNVVVDGAIYNSNITIILSPLVGDILFSWLNWESKPINSNYTNWDTTPTNWDFYSTLNSSNTYIQPELSLEVSLQSLDENEDMELSLPLLDGRTLNVLLKRTSLSIELVGASMVGACEYDGYINITSPQSLNLSFRNMMLYDKIHNMFAKFGFDEKEYHILNESEDSIQVNIFTGNKCSEIKVSSC